MKHDSDVPWWVPYIIIFAYFCALTYGWLVVDKVTTPDYFIQFGLLMAGAFGIQMSTTRKGKNRNVDIEADNVDVKEK